MARKDPLFRVYLHELQARYQQKPERVLSFMQWPDAQRWFNVAADSDGIYYILRVEHRGLSPSEIYNQLKQIYE